MILFWWAARAKHSTAQNGFSKLKDAGDYLQLLKSNNQVDKDAIRAPVPRSVKLLA